MIRFIAEFLLLLFPYLGKLYKENLFLIVVLVLGFLYRWLTLDSMFKPGLTFHNNILRNFRMEWHLIFDLFFHL